MTELELIQAESPPRSAALARRLAGRIDDLLGFVVYGIVWLIVAAVSAFVVMIKLDSFVGEHPRPWVDTAVTIADWGTFVIAWVPFAMWVARRRRSAARLFRDGTLVDGVVERVTSLTVPTQLTNVAVRTKLPGGEKVLNVGVAGIFDDVIAKGDVVPVLFVAGYPYAAAFLPDGKAVPVAI